MKEKSSTKLQAVQKRAKATNEPSINIKWIEKAKLIALPKLGVHPKSDRVIILPMEPERMSSGGIIIPDTVKEAPLVGLVVAVGPGRGEDEPMTVKPGELVLYGKYAGSEYLAPDGVTYLIMRMTDISGELY